MFGKLTYLVYVLAFCLIPIGLFWSTNFRFLRNNWKVIVGSALVLFTYFCLSDTIAEAWHNWFFSGDRNIGFFILNFPIEEALFFLLVPIAVASATLCSLAWIRGRNSSENH